MVPRLLEAALSKASSHYPIVTLTGPRQSGKTTLVRSLWPEKTYASLEDPDVLDFAISDPRGFLEQGKETGLIVDEAQRHPPLFRYLQGYADRSEPGRYVLSGSNNFLLMEKIGQSLAGRTAVLVLLPFSGEELGKEALGESWEDAAWQGFYPRVRSLGLPADMFARDYLATYVERDLRLVKNVSDLSAFRRFLDLCAGRAGQLLNLSALSADAGIAVNTVKAWLSLIEAAWLVFRLPPWHENITSRLVKSPKLYWHDTSLLCRLLGLRSPEDLRSHPLRGAVFENLVVADRFKAATHRGEEPDLHFWRDAAGREVDLIEGVGKDRLIWECKSGGTVAQEFFKGLDFFGNETGIPPDRRRLVYGGAMSGARSAGEILDWRSALAAGRLS
ncbi:MAG: ATP-binding protein [Rectinemataceae bacterium]